MPVSITIRNVPDETRDELAARAAATGRSLQEYLRAELMRLTSKPDPETFWAQVAEHKQRYGTQLPPETIVRHIREDRGD